MNENVIGQGFNEAANEGRPTTERKGSEAKVCKFVEGEVLAWVCLHPKIRGTSLGKGFGPIQAKTCPIKRIRNRDCTVRGK